MHEPQTAETPQAGQMGTAAAAAILRVSHDTVRRQAAMIGGRKIFGRWRFDAALVETLAAEGQR